MLSLSAKLLLSLDAASVQAVRVAWGLRGRLQKPLARRALASGALVPGPLERNIRRPEEIRDAVRTVAEGAGASGRPTILVLPDGVARTLLVDVPAGTEPREYGRFRLGADLPYPVSDAVVEVVPVGGGRYVAAAVKRAIASEYE